MDACASTFINAHNQGAFHARLIVPTINLLLIQRVEHFDAPLLDTFVMPFNRHRQRREQREQRLYNIEESVWQSEGRLYRAEVELERLRMVLSAATTFEWHDTDHRCEENREQDSGEWSLASRQSPTISVLDSPLDATPCVTESVSLLDSKETSSPRKKPLAAARERLRLKRDEMMKSSPIYLALKFPERFKREEASNNSTCHHAKDEDSTKPDSPIPEDDSESRPPLSRIEQATTKTTTTTRSPRKARRKWIPPLRLQDDEENTPPPHLRVELGPNEIEIHEEMPRPRRWLRRRRQKPIVL